MNASKTKSPRSLESDLARVDAHAIAPEEYDELPELTDDLITSATPLIGEVEASREVFTTAAKQTARGRPVDNGNRQSTEPAQCAICGTYTDQREMWAGICRSCQRKLV